jgi:hypothetical protein
MKLIQRIIYTGFAAVAIASAAMPVFPAHSIHHNHVMQGPDFGWYAEVGKPATLDVVGHPQPREGWIWSPQHWEWDGNRHVWVEGRWVRDDYAEQVAVYNLGVPATMVAGIPAPPARVIVFEERR